MAKKTNFTDEQFTILCSAMHDLEDSLTKAFRTFYKEYGYTQEQMPDYMQGSYETLLRNRETYERAHAILWDVVHDLKEPQE
jgi:hypothetical protein